MSDIGITQYAVYLPRYRMDRKVISNAMAWLSPAGMKGEKAVANYDEDSVTMAVTAGMDCLNDKSVESVYFATTTNPYGEGGGAEVISTALALPSNIRTVDFGNSLKAGTSALLSACESVKSGTVGTALVCAAECRVGKAGTPSEMLFGDGAAAAAVGNSDVIAALKGSYAVAYDFPDYRRLAQSNFVFSPEDTRFVREQGYAKFISEAVLGLFSKYGVTAKSFAKIAFPCLDVRQYAGIGRSLGFQPEQLQEPLLGVVGELGTASPLVALACMLDQTKAGDNLLVVGHGGGAEVLWFTATDRIRGGQTVSRALARKKPLANYEQYLAFRGMLPIENGLLGDSPATQQPLVWRERKQILALTGTKCKRCGTPQYPSQNICINMDCCAVNEMEDYVFSRKPASLFSYLADTISFTLDPPFWLAVVDFEGGGRHVFQITDCDADQLALGTPVTMMLRKKYDDRARSLMGYFWKAVPATAA